MSVQYPIQVAARLSGLSPHVIRIWEKRYGAVAPARTETNRRLYTEAEVERLKWLARATAAGHQIGMIARLGVEELMRLVAVVEPSGGSSAAVLGPVSDTAGAPGVEGRGGEGVRVPDRPGGDGLREVGGASLNSTVRVWPLPVGDGVDAAEGLVREAVAATRAFDSGALLEVIERGTVRFGHNGVLHRLVAPLARQIGELWQRGEVTAAHEHFASALIRDSLGRSMRPFGMPEGAPRVVVATPAGQLHELGAVMVGAAAANLGWRTIYLGASLPAAEIAGAALQNRVRAVLLSIVYPADDRQLEGELRQLRRFLPPSVAVIVGGRAAVAYDAVLREIGAVVPADLGELGALLGALRGVGDPGRDDAPTPGI